MTEVKRYDITGDKYGDGTVMQSEFGQVVFFEDYAALQQKLDAVLAENVAMKSFVQKECCVYRSGMVVNAEAYFPETPATDAILNAVRAEAKLEVLSELAGDLDARMKNRSTTLRRKSFPGFAWAAVETKRAELSNSLRADAAKDGE